jgi:hypothetical protein
METNEHSAREQESGMINQTKLFPLYNGDLSSGHPKLTLAIICILTLAAIALAVWIDPHV